MNCEAIRELLPLYEVGMNDEELRKMVEDHLPGCAACRKALDEEYALRRGLSEIPVVPLPEGLQARLAQAIRDEGSRIWHRRRRSLLLRFSSAAAVLMLGLFALAMGGHWQEIVSSPEASAEHPLTGIRGVSLLDSVAEESEEAVEAVKGAGAEASAEAVTDFASENEAALPVSPYLLLLAEELSGRQYRVISWEEPEPEVFLIRVALAEGEVDAATGRGASAAGIESGVLAKETGDAVTRAAVTGQEEAGAGVIEWTEASYQGQEGRVWRIE